MEFGYSVSKANTDSVSIPAALLIIASVFFSPSCGPRTSSAKLLPSQLSYRIVETQYGRLRGLMSTLPPTLNLPPVEIFLGLQYASLLDGELRFMPATSPTEKWEGVRVASKFKPVCPQRVPRLEELTKKMPARKVDRIKRMMPFLEKQSEDCLSLNMYVPSRDANDTTLFSILVFIHGESYEMGTGNAYDGGVLAAFGRMIVITLNYRLGPLGFLSTADSNAPGNYALLDIVAALHWIRENTEAFGGDPDSVALFGHGHGAALVNLLMISPVTRDRHLFRRAIVQSGSAFSSWSIVSDPLLYTKRLASLFNCSSSSPLPDLGGSPPPVGPGSPSLYTGLIHCLKQRSADDLVSANVNAPKYLSAFGPTMDRRTVPLRRPNVGGKEAVIFYSGNELLAGFSNDEGASYMSQKDLDEGFSAERTYRLVRSYIQSNYRYHRQSIYDVLRHQYKNWDSSTDEDRHLPDVAADSLKDHVIQMLTDAQFAAPILELLQAHARLHTSSTYMYSVDYSGQRNVYRTSDADELSLAFGAPLAAGECSPFSSAFTRLDAAQSRMMITYWSNFVKTGNPNLSQVSKSGPVPIRYPASDSMLEWPAYTNDRQEYLNIGIKTDIQQRYQSAKMALWLDLIPRLHKSNNLDQRFHLLEDADNLTTFEELVQDQEIPEAEAMRSPPLSDSSIKADQHPVKIRNATSYSDSSSFKISHPINARRTSVSVITRLARVTPPIGLTSESNSSTLPLSVTIGVGCSLLLLNIIVFLIVYTQKDRFTNIRSKRHFLGGATNIAVQSKYNVDSMNVVSFATTSQSYATYHQQQQQQVLAADFLKSSRESQSNACKWLQTDSASYNGEITPSDRTNFHDSLSSTAV